MNRLGFGPPPFAMGYAGEYLLPPAPPNQMYDGRREAPFYVAAAAAHTPHYSREERRPRKGERNKRSKSANHARSPNRVTQSHSRGRAEKDPLNQWSQWRTGINDDLGRDLVRNTYRPILVGREFDDLIRPSSKTKKGVYNYSSTIDQATQLQKEDFVNFGIPRAQLSVPATNRRVREDFSDDSDSESDVPFYSINRLPGDVRRGGPYPIQQPIGRPSRRDHSSERYERSRGQHRHLSPEIIVRNGSHGLYR
ncbi:uncharacterized protein [Watersipora subatra]|uniref:uncharacterized protein n=1 Tax=Watersipora subatra TaxID=2589382 RepID=UPI00355AF28A